MHKPVLYINTLYVHTQFSNYCNSDASGNKGQEVAKTRMGTVTWIPSDRRIVIANTVVELTQRIRAVFPPWEVNRDMAARYSRGKIPLQIKEAIREAETPTPRTEENLFH